MEDLFIKTPFENEDFHFFLPMLNVKKRKNTFSSSNFDLYRKN